MADIILGTRSLSITRGQSAVYDGARGTNGAPASFVDTVSTFTAPASTTIVSTTIATDVLLAAQQSREPDRVRGFEVRAAYERASRRLNEDTPPRDTDQQASPEETETPLSDPQAIVLDGNVVHLFTSTPEAEADQTAPSRAATPPERAQFSRANQAYVLAGATDGLLFARAGVDTSLRPERANFDILI